MRAKIATYAKLVDSIAVEWNGASPSFMQKCYRFNLDKKQWWFFYQKPSNKFRMRKIPWRLVIFSTYFYLQPV